jgi:hypothetical protein
MKVVLHTIRLNSVILQGRFPVGERGNKTAVDNLVATVV